MPFISVTNTFVNGSTADATQVNQNFTDIINGTSDGTKNINISALTCGSTGTFNANIILGLSSSNTLTLNASLASTININSNTSYDIGASNTGLRALYLGGGGSLTTKLISATLGSSWTMTLPTGAGTSKYKMETDGTGVTSWVYDFNASDLKNLSLSATVASNNLTVALKGADGNDPSSTNPVDIVFRSSTAATGTPTTRRVTAGSSVTLNNGSTLGLTSAVNEYIYVYALDNAGTVEIGVVGGAQILDELSRQSSTAEGSGTATSRYTLYSTTNRTNVAIRLLGRLKSNQTTSGTYASSISEISLGSSATPKQNRHIITLTAGNGFGAVATKIRRYSNTLESIGTAITYADSANNGTTFTINEEGEYFGMTTDSFSAGTSGPGFSLNTSSTSTNLSSTADAEIISSFATAPAGQVCVNTFQRRLKPGDIVRPHSDGSENSTSTKFSRVTIMKVSD